MVRWAQGHGIEIVVVNYQPVGPARSLVDALETRLAECGIAVCPLVGDLDRQAWPAADKGYFKLRKRIPELLTRLAAQPAAGVPAG